MTNSQKKTIQTEYEIFESQNDLPEDEKKLVEKARDAANNAYSPYSKFSVGAAVLLKNGEVVIGSNQENVAYGPTNCAERSALFAVGSLGKKDMVSKIAIIARPTAELESAVSIEEELPGTPCGTCRQVMKEYEVLSGQKMTILCLFNSDRVFRFDGIDTLLPFAFGPKVLAK